MDEIDEKQPLEKAIKPGKDTMKLYPFYMGGRRISNMLR